MKKVLALIMILAIALVCTACVQESKTQMSFTINNKTEEMVASLTITDINHDGNVLEMKEIPVDSSNTTELTVYLKNDQPNLEITFTTEGQWGTTTTLTDKNVKTLNLLPGDNGGKVDFE